MAASFCCCRRHGLWFPSLRVMHHLFMQLNTSTIQWVELRRGVLLLMEYGEIRDTTEIRETVVCLCVYCILVIVTCLSVCVFICEGQPFAVILFREAWARCRAVYLDGDRRCLLDYSEMRMQSVAGPFSGNCNSTRVVPPGCRGYRQVVKCDSPREGVKSHV